MFECLSDCWRCFYVRWSTSDNRSHFVLHSLCKSHFVQGVLEGSTLSTLGNYAEADVLTTKTSRIQKHTQSWWKMKWTMKWTGNAAQMIGMMMWTMFWRFVFQLDYHCPWKVVSKLPNKIVLLHHTIQYSFFQGTRFFTLFYFKH